MAPAAAKDLELPPSSALDEALNISKSSEYSAHLHHLALTILHNLQYQHDWTSLSIHGPSSPADSLLPRPILAGLPPRRAYIHPDEQVEILKAEHETGKPIGQTPEPEWVLPSHWEEKWSLAQFAAVFDALDTAPPINETSSEAAEETVGYKWRGKNRQKRLLLATLHDDSTVVYYIVHDGIVKPRQN